MEGRLFARNLQPDMGFEYHGEFIIGVSNRYLVLTCSKVPWFQDIFVKQSRMLSKDVVCAVSIAEISMLLVSMMSGFKISMISGGLSSVSGSITTLIHLQGTTIG